MFPQPAPKFPHPAPNTFANFSGYTSPTFTPIPDQLLDQHLADLSGAELKVVLYICRRTFGFQRASDNISLNQLMDGIVKRDGTRLDSGTGLSKSTLLETLKSLTDKRIVIAVQRTSPDRGYIPTNYRLNTFAPPLTLGRNSEQVMAENRHPLGRKIDLGDGLKTDPPLGTKIDLPIGRKIDPTINSDTKNSFTKDSDHNNTPEAKIVLPPTAVVVALTSFGLNEAVAVDLASRFDEGLIREKIEFLQYMQEQGSIEKPAGWLRKAIEQNYARPDGFLTMAEREAQEQQRRAREAQAVDEQLRRVEAQMRQEEEARQRREAHVRNIRSQYGATEEEQALAEAVKKALKAMQYEPRLLPDMELLKRTEQGVLIAVTDAESFRRVTRSERSKIPIQRVLMQITRQTLGVEFVLQIEEPTAPVLEERAGEVVASRARRPAPQHWMVGWGQRHQALQQH